jgi:hypothetical protein
VIEPANAAEPQTDAVANVMALRVNFFIEWISTNCWNMNALIRESSAQAARQRF